MAAGVTAAGGSGKSSGNAFPDPHSARGGRGPTATPTADLSVVIPNYNHAPYLPRCLGALLSQSVLPREIIVLDDASTDNSVAVVKCLAGRSPLIRLVRNEQN